MTDQDIRDYIEELDQPLFLREIMSELREDDPTLSFKRVTRILRDMGFENKPCTNVRNPKGKGSAWFRTGNAVPTCGDDDNDYEAYDDDDADNVDDYDDEADGNAVYDAENTEDTEDTKAKTRSAADALRDVNAQNAANAELSAKLFESLNRSRSLKEELMRRQQEALLELARRILGLYGSEKERREYGSF